ncbi:hypothetical protein HAX54_040971, partial [Datura stramonium]|nr:hypothetical protein [Datura stramonium]
MGTMIINYSLVRSGEMPMKHRFSGSPMSCRWKLHCPNVLLTIGGLSAVRGSLPVVRWNSA